MWLCENPQKRRIVIQNDKQNEVAVITYAAVSISGKNMPWWQKRRPGKNQVSHGNENRGIIHIADDRRPP